MGRQLILIWGGLILVYLLVKNSAGAASFIKGAQSFVGGTTSTLQGR
jgi:hypothetical protein